MSTTAADNASAGYNDRDKENITANSNSLVNLGTSSLNLSTTAQKKEEESRKYDMGVRLLHALVQRNYPSALGLSMIGADNSLVLPDTIQTPLHLAVERGMKGVIKELTEKNANLEARDCWDLTPLLQAVLNGDQLAARILLEAGATTNPSPPSRYQQTPLHLAVRRNRASLVGILIDNKAELNAPSTINVGDVVDHDWHQQNEYTDTALHDAARKGNLEIVERLVDAKADLGAVDSRRRTPLLLASRDGHAAVARYMLMKGADVHAVSVDGRTAMHMAASRGQNRIVQMLMDSETDGKKKKAMTWVKDCNGDTPRDVAMQRIAIKIMDGEARRGSKEICEQAYLKRSRSPLSPKSHPSFANQDAK